MAGESTGWGGEFWLHNGSALVELVGVTECGFPEVSVELLESSNLKSPDKFKEFIGGMKEGSEFTVVMNYIPRSPTDLACEAAISKVRAFKIVEPDYDGTGVQNVTGTVLVMGYAPAPMTQNEVRKATLTLKLTSAYSKAAA